MTLEQLLDLQPESTILSFLLLAPPRAFSGLELSKRLGMQPGKFNAAIASLIRHGQVKQFVKRNVRYYILNSKVSILPEIRAALMKDKKRYEDELFVALERLGKVQAAFLSGIFVGRTELPVDMLIIGKPSSKKVDTFIENCERLMGHQEINYSVMTPEEFRERRHTFDRFIKDIFDYPHLVVFDKLKK